MRKLAKQAFSTIIFSLTVLLANTSLAFDLANAPQTQEVAKNCQDLGGVKVCSCVHKDKAWKIKRCDKWLAKKCGSNGVCPEGIFGGGKVCFC